MQRFCQTLALLFALFPFAAASHAKDDRHDEDRAVITAAYILVDTAYENKDVDGIVAPLSDDWKEVEKDGSPTKNGKKEKRDILTQAFSVPMKVTSHTTVSNVVFTSEGATVTYTNNLTFAADFHGTKSTFNDKSTERDTWIKSGDTWIVKQTQEVVGRTFVDGKPDK